MESTLRKIGRLEDSRKNWREINNQHDSLRDHEREIAMLKNAVADLRQKPKWSEAGEGGGKVQRARVTATSSDFITCTLLKSDGTDGGAVTVAKPYHLRVTTWNGQRIGDWTYTGSADARTATYAGVPVAGGLQPGDTIGEILDPPYIGSQLFIAKVEGGTGVVGADWIDLNADARRYVAVRDAVTVCKVINNVNTSKRLVLEGGPAV